MDFLGMFRSLLARASNFRAIEPRSIVILQRKAYTFSEEELRGAAERAWGKRFDGEEDPMYFVSAHVALTVVKAGAHIIRVTSTHVRYAEDDEYVLSQLPQPEQRKAWTEHHSSVFLDLFNDLSRKSKRIANADAYDSH